MVGHWKEESVQKKLAIWIRAALAWFDWQEAKVARFGDNMREVAVTEGDKVQAQIQMGYSVYGYGVGDLVQRINEVSDNEINKLVQEYKDQYEIIGDVRGLGPMIGMELVKDRASKEPAGDEAAELVKRCYEKGLIVIRCGPYHNVIRILMPLVITDDQLEEGFAILEDRLKEIA